MSSWDFNVATFNTQGLRMDNLKTVSIARDAEKRNIWVKGLTKRQIRESTIEQPGGNKKKCTANHNGIEGTNWHKGVGILIEGEISSTFTRVIIEIAIPKYNWISIKLFYLLLMILPWWSMNRVGAFLYLPKNITWYLPTQYSTIRCVIELLWLPLREWQIIITMMEIQGETQIDHALIKNTLRRLVHTSRLHAGFEINSNHKGVILNMKLD